MIAQARVKTITYHTRKQAIALYEELKNKIKTAYQFQTDQSFLSLMALIRLIYYMAPMPLFLKEINKIGTLPVINFLQNLLVKSKMIRISFVQPFQGWIIALFKQFQNAMKGAELIEAKVLKELPFNEQLYFWEAGDAASFINSILKKSVQSNDLGLLASIIIVFRNYLIYMEQHTNKTSKQQSDWAVTIQYLIKACWLLNNIVRQEAAICISHYLCLKQDHLCSIAIEHGAVTYILQKLSNKFIPQAFARKIVQYLIFLFFHAPLGSLKHLDLQNFQQILSELCNRFNKQSVTISVRRLINITNKKLGIANDLMFDKIYQLYENNSSEVEKQKYLSILSLYFNSNKLKQLAEKQQKKLLLLLKNQASIKIFMKLAQMICKNVNIDKIDGEVAQQILNKIERTIFNEDLKEYLNSNQKKPIIDITEIINKFLENKKLYKITEQLLINSMDKLLQFSDCLNFQYEKQLIKILKILGIQCDFHKLVFEKLSDDLIMKAQTTLCKPTQQLFGQIKLLKDLLQNPFLLKQVRLPSQLSEYMISYIHPKFDLTFTNQLLGSIESQGDQQTRKKVNLQACRLLSILISYENNYDSMKSSIFDLSQSQGEYEQFYSIIRNLSKDNQRKVRDKQDQGDQPSIELITRQQQISQKISDYFNAQVLNYRFLIDLQQSDLKRVLYEIAQYQNQQYLYRFLKILIEISQSLPLSQQIFIQFGPRLSLMYNYLLSSAQQKNRQNIFLIEILFIRLIKAQLHYFFIQQFMEVNYWLELFGIVDLYFDVYLNKKRLVLLELIIQFLDISKLLNLQILSKMASSGKRIYSIKKQALQSKGETLGILILSDLHQQFTILEELALNYKQNISNLIEGGCQHTNIPRFIALFYKYTSKELFDNYELGQWASSALIILQKYIEQFQIIISASYEGTERMLIIGGIAQALFQLNQRNQLSVERSLVQTQQKILIKFISYCVYSLKPLQSFPYKKFYVQELLIKSVSILVKLYRKNYKHHEIGVGDLINFFEEMMGLANEAIKDSVGELMRILLLKKEARMMGCQCYEMCKAYRDTLPSLCQQHIYFCQIIEHILEEDGSLDEQYNIYFENTQNNRIVCSEVEQILTTLIYNPSAYLISDVSNSQKDIGGFVFKQLGIQRQTSLSEAQPLLLQIDTDKEVISLKNLGHQSNQLQHINSLRKIQDALSRQQSNQHNQNQLQFDRQSQIQSSTKLIQKLQQLWTEQQLLESLKQFIDQPNSLRLQQIFNNLVLVSSKKYYDLLVKLFLQTKHTPQIFNNQQFTQSQFLDKIIASIPIQFCEPEEKLYQIISSGLEGAKLGLRFKGFGIKGLQIYARKLMNSLKQNDVILYSTLLSEKKSFQQLKCLKNWKIHEVLNDKIPFFISNDRALSSLCGLLQQICKYPPLCNSFQLSDMLSIQATNKQTKQELRSILLKTIRCLIAQSQKHKQNINSNQFLSDLIKLLKSKNKDQMGSICEILFICSEDNSEVSQIYQSYRLQETILELLRQQVKNQIFEQQFIFNILKILANLACLPQSSANILKGNFMALCKPLSQTAIKMKFYQIMGAIINVLRNMLEEMELSMTKVLNQLEKQGLFAFTLWMGEYLSKSHHIQSYLDILIRLILNSTFNKRIFENVEKVIIILANIARDQLNTQILLDIWIKTIFLLVQSNRYSHMNNVVKLNIFFSAANSMRSFNNLADSNLTMNKRMLKEIQQKKQASLILNVNGYVDFLVELLRMSNLSNQEYLRIIDKLVSFYKVKNFTGTLCTRLFSIVMNKLQLQWKDNNISVPSIGLLKLIRNKVQITAQFGSLMLDFVGKFITQSSKITLYDYYVVSREVICLLSSFLVHNQQIRHRFRNRIIIDIVSNWLKLARALNYNEMPQTYRLFYYSVHTSQSLFTDLCSISSKKISQAEGILSQGFKCNLYRLNGTYKNAVFKLGLAKDEFFAFKIPEGAIKQKYRIIFKDILIIQKYASVKDALFLQSSFLKSSNIFQHKPNPLSCLTILTLSDQNQIRQVSIQLQSPQLAFSVYEKIKIIYSRWRENLIQMQSRQWGKRNRK